MQNIKCPVCDSTLSIDGDDVVAIKSKRNSFLPSQSRIQVLMNIIYILIGALLAFAGVSLPGCSDDDNDNYLDDYTTETDTGEQLQPGTETNRGEQLQPGTETDTGEQLQPDSETDTEQLQPDSETDTEQLQPDSETDSTEQWESIAPTVENCPLIEPFLEVCDVMALQPFKNSCKGSMMTGYTLCVFECATKPLDECEINSIIFECTDDRCLHYESCMQLCSR